MSFNSYNHVVQTTANSCGAFALAAALVHLGRIQSTYVLNVADLSQSYNQPRPDLLAQFIYQSTGCLFLNHPQATYRYLNPVGDMNPPSALACKATEFNVAHINTFYNNAAEAVFSAFQVMNGGVAPGANLLETEINLIASPRYGNVDGPLNYDTLPKANEVHLLLVNNNNHWVAITNTQIYNPTDGFVGVYTFNPPFNTINYHGAPNLLPFCGVWISLLQP